MKPREFRAVPESVLNHLPEGHPAREEHRLTLFQQFALPILLWFFDSQRNRATGRSHLMAYVCIELAMRGEEVHLEDASMTPLFKARHSHIYHHFVPLVLRIIDTEFVGHRFDYDTQHNRLRYVGRKPHGTYDRREWLG